MDGIEWRWRRRQRNDDDNNVSFGGTNSDIVEHFEEKERGKKTIKGQALPRDKNHFWKSGGKKELEIFLKRVLKFFFAR